MRVRALALLLCLLLAGCTRVIDTPQPKIGTPVAPIPAGQVGDLLSQDAQKGDDGNLFVTVEPDECSGLAREVDPPFIFDAKPAAHGGGHWVADVGRQVYIEEIVAVYHATFDPRATLAQVTRTIESCAGTSLTVTALDGDVDTYRVLPQPDSGSPDIVAWSFAAGTWACDNSFVAAHNAAIEITTCAAVGGYDVLSLAQDALQRIETLANTTA
ncbi:MAG: sensor domain-containing protein [Mycobacterium sp.]